MLTANKYVYQTPLHESSSFLRCGCNFVEARFEAMAEKNEASQKKQEEDVDSSLALLERLQQTQQTHTAPPQEKPYPT